MKCFSKPKINKYNKKEVVATTCTIILLAIGTFAWQSFSQIALNESSHMFRNPGGRLHDDYDGSNKDIYVENFTGEKDGLDIFARIRIDEYMEYGEGAGTTEPEDITLLRGDILNDGVPLLGDVTTWDTYNYGSEAVEANETIRTYRDLGFGGQTVYMPTFNKNQNSLDSDINGTYAGPDGDRTTDYDRYGDYLTYEPGDESEPTDALYAVAGNAELDHVVPDQVHTAKETLKSTVLSMEEWMEKGSPIGKYWVYDIDGWAYWADAIEPDTATGLLLDEVIVTDDYDGEWYYAINVVAQLATAGDWGDLASANSTATGMYEGGMTNNAQLLLNKISDTDTQVDGNYFDEEDGVGIYFNDVQSRINNVYDSKGVVNYDVDHQGDKISLYTLDDTDIGNGIATISDDESPDEGCEVEFDNGISMAGADVCFTFSDLEVYGYESFTAYLGTHYIARYVNSAATSFTFEIRLDGETEYKSDMFTAYSPMEYIDIDLRGHQVMQILVDTNGSGTGDYAAMGDPTFHKDEASPYMDVFDLEFNQPYQVTKSNLLYYAEAWDIDGIDISDKITYTTDYVEGAIGEYSITYSVTSTRGYTSQRTVKLTVTGDDYTQPWTMEDYKTPYVNYMYHSRNTLTPEGRKLFDVVIASVLDFNPEGGEYYTVTDYTASGETVYQLNFDLEKIGVYMNVSQYQNSYHSICTDTDPRAYLFKQWSSGNRYSVNSETGLLKTQVMFISKSWYNQYDEMIPLIIENSERFLAEAKDDMTDVQKLYYVTTLYKEFVKYSDGGFLPHSMALGYAKCGGNSMGVVFLAQRLGMLSLYGQVYTSGGVLHAATYQKLPEEDGWYMCDKLYAKQWTSPLLSGFSLRERGTYGWIDYAPTSIEAYKYSTYPSIWMDLTDTTIIMEKGDNYNLEANITGINSVLDDPMTKDIVTISIKDSTGKSCDSDTSKLDIGVYTVSYDIHYEGEITVDRTYEVELVVYTNETMFDSSMVIASGVNTASDVIGYGTRTLWNAYTSSEESFDSSCSINNGGYITLDNSAGHNVISLKYGPSSNVRASSYAISNCKIALYVYYDGVLQTNTNSLTAYSHYASLQLYIPDGVKEIKLLSHRVNSAAAHGTIADIRLYDCN